MVRSLDLVRIMSRSPPFRNGQGRKMTRLGNFDGKKFILSDFGPSPTNKEAFYVESYIKFLVWPLLFLLNMMLPDHDLLQFSWSSFNDTDSCLNELTVYGLGMDADKETGFSLFSTVKDSPDIEFIPYSPTMLSEEHMNFPIHFDEAQYTIPSDVSSLTLEELETILSNESEDVFGWVEENKKSYPSKQVSVEGHYNWSFSPSMKSADAFMDMELIDTSITLPKEDMKMDNQLSIIHLVKAYGEAMEKGQKELEVVLMNRIQEKVSPVGEIMGRLSYYLFQHTDKEANYLKQESAKNFNAAFQAFYQIFPYGRFTHFAANSAILEAMPLDAETIHIIDFDMGEGLQWSSMIEAIVQKPRKTVRLTSIKQREENCTCAASQWRFEQTKRHLYDHAKSVGLKLKVEEMELQGVMYEIKRMKKKGERNEWLAFNCMVGLPHMGSTGTRRQVMEFMRVAEELTAHSENNNRGIITFGDGEGWEKQIKYSSSFMSFFDEYLLHYQALLESMEWTFPSHFAEARIAMECLFVAPHVSSLGWFQKWEEMKESDCKDDLVLGLEGWIVSQESLMEAKQMVREGESEYRVKIEENSMNVMVLEWRGAPLVRVSSWT